jgi:CheY-like chemotaxis protein
VKKRLLLVDDEPELLQTLKVHFERQYEVDTASSGAAAIERFVRQRPDVVFVDVNMPGISGLEILKLFKQSDASIPIIESATLDAARARRPAGDAKTDGRPEAPATAGESDASASTAEGGLVSDAAEIKRQAAEARAPEGGANLLSS